MCSGSRLTLGGALLEGGKAFLKGVGRGAPAADNGQLRWPTPRLAGWTVHVLESREGLMDARHVSCTS